jgi:hypothetical protein
MLHDAPMAAQLAAVPWRQDPSPVPPSFLGGVERTFDRDSTLGFHLVSNCNVSEDDLREITTLESLYLLEMGVDTRLMTLLIEAGPRVMRGIRPDEARNLRVTTSDLPTQCSACP